MVYYAPEYIAATGISLLIVMSLSITSIAYFYWKSVKLASPFMAYEPQSTKIYIKGMIYYSLGQILTYLPYMFFSIFLFYLPISISLNTLVSLTSLSYSLAGLSGFVTVMVFIRQGPMGYHKPKIEPIIHGDSFISYE